MEIVRFDFQTAGKLAKYTDGGQQKILTRPTRKIFWNTEEPDPIVDFQGNIDRYIDKIYAVGLNDDGTENTLLAHSGTPEVNPAHTDGSKGQCMVKIPRLFYKEYLDGNGELEAVVLRESAKSDFVMHPKFSWGSGRKHIYMGMFEAGNESNKMTSISGNATETSQSLATFRSRAAARGTGWHQLDMWTQHLVDLLYYAEIKNRDAKVAIPGFDGLSAWNAAYRRVTGRSNVLTTRDGSVEWSPGTEIGGTWSGGLDSDIAQAIEDEAVSWRDGFDPIIANRFLWVENFYGHIYKMNDGVVYVPGFDFDAGGGDMWNGTWGKELGAVYATPDPSKFSSTPADIRDDYDHLHLVSPVVASGDAYIKNVGSAFIPVEHGGGSDTHFASIQYNLLSDATRDYLRLVLAGGRLSNGAHAGVAFRAVPNSLGATSALNGSRLCYENI